MMNDVFLMSLLPAMFSKDHLFDLLVTLHQPQQQQKKKNQKQLLEQNVLHKTPGYKLRGEQAILLEIYFFGGPLFGLKN